MHIAKYGRCAVGNLIKHYESSDRRSSLQHVNHERTRLNYNLIDEPGLERYRHRLSELSVPKRKDAKTLCDLIVTAPKELTVSREQQWFFFFAFEYAKRKFGEQNIVSASVHHDEKTPHIHIAFIPATGDRCCCKEVITRSMLQKLHKEFQRLLERAHSQGYFKRPVSVITGETGVKGNRTVNQLRYEQLQREYAALETRYNAMVTEGNRIQAELKDKIASLTAQCTSLETELAEHQKKLFEIEGSDFRPIFRDELDPLDR